MLRHQFPSPLLAVRIKQLEFCIGSRLTTSLFSHKAIQEEYHPTQKPVNINHFRSGCGSPFSKSGNKAVEPKLPPPDQEHSGGENNSSNGISCHNPSCLKLESEVKFLDEVLNQAVEMIVSHEYQIKELGELYDQKHQTYEGHPQPISKGRVAGGAPKWLVLVW